MRSTVPTNVAIALKIGTANTSVTVEANGGDLVENESTFHTDVDQGIMTSCRSKARPLRSPRWSP